MLPYYSGVDFHCLRLDDGGKWSQKHGQTAVINTDVDGKEIEDPRKANIKPYTFVTFMKIFTNIIDGPLHPWGLSLSWGNFSGNLCHILKLSCWSYILAFNLVLRENGVLIFFLDTFINFYYMDLIVFFLIFDIDFMLLLICIVLVDFLWSKWDVDSAYGASL